MKKILLRIVLGVVVLLVAAILLILLLLDPLAKTAVQEGAGYALGVETRVDKLDLSLLGGTLTMDGMRVANPKGFASEHLMYLQHFVLEVKPASVFGDTVEVPTFELDGLDMNIEQKGTGSNISVIMDNLKRLESGEEAKREERGKKVRVDQVKIRNVVAHFHLLGGKATVKVPEIELKDVSTGDEGGVVISDLVARLVPAILAAVVEKGEGVVPAGFLKDLDTRVADLSKAMGIENLTRQAEEAIRKEAENTLKKGIGDLFEGLGGKKEEEGDVP